ncbi:hypothetical protein EDD36DRAFT_459294 [Exophiala viscosa]|uniref:UBA domain-containing protein n=1 Tax=Exophiala viscosa TaxID=2486360 RepID=A0AAN6E3T8_9EURO|nr:hypothetical protein EDD36DRAFT_459294 [Exophiala viscosa]
MAGTQPSADQISQVCGIAAVDESSARILLRKANNDVNAAVNAFFEDPVGSLKDQPATEQWQDQDNIPFADDSSMGGMPALSRPPSRIGHNRSFVDLSNEHAAASNFDAATLKEEEEMNDPAIQRAMAESLGQTLPAQENGVTGAGAHFGPAKREHYDPANWALTTYSTAREIIDHPPPSKRRRIDDEPAFLRGSKETDYLAPLLTIYHSIPLAREALLMPSLKIHNYGHEASWWSGTSDENTKALSTDSTLQVDRDECNVLAEVQCLMAFLDRSNRAYGSVDALADLQRVRSGNGQSSLRFMQAWASAAVHQDPHEQLTQVFTSVAVKHNVSGSDPRDETTLFVVEPPTNPALGQTLVDLLDTTVWDDNSHELDDVWIDHAAEIFTIRVHDPQEGKSGVNLTLDPVWYPDRYLYECRDVMRQLRKQLQVIRREIEQCTMIQRRCEVVKLPDNRLLMTRDVLNAAVKASAGVTGKKPVQSGSYEGQRSISEDSVSTAAMEEVRSELQNLLGRIEQKSQQLEQKKTELRQRMREISLQLTKPTQESPHLPQRKYTLRGVSTKPNITYVRRRNSDLLHLDDDESTSEDPDSQWWRMSWLQDPGSQQLPPAQIGPVTKDQAEADRKAQEPTPDGGSRPFTIVKVRENEVLEAVKSEHHSVLLVYANENAMNFKASELSLPLRHFVDRDNQAFAEELQEEEGTALDTSGDLVPETEFEDVPLIDRTGSNSSVQEFTPMSMSSPARDEDGQPSPKRAKESNASLFSEQPPSYEDSVDKQEMQERKGNKIGLYAGQMLQKYGGDTSKESDAETIDGGESMHIEHSN